MFIINKSCIINQFSNYNIKPELKSCEEDSLDICFFIYDDFHTTYLSIINNLNVLKYNYNIHILVKQSLMNTENFRFYVTEMIMKNKNNITFHTICENFTYNEYNNLFYSIEFYEKFTSKYVLFLNSVVVLKSDCISNILADNCHTLTSAFYPNSIITENVYNTDLTFRNIKKIISVLKQNELISLTNPSNEIEYYGHFQNNLRKKINLERILENFYFSGKMNSSLGIINENTFTLVDYIINMRYLVE